MTKKTKKRQSAIVTLNDRNQAELNEVRQQRAQMMAEFEKRKDGTFRGIRTRVSVRLCVCVSACWCLCARAHAHACMFPSLIMLAYAIL